MLILYASQTGNALDTAERISREAERRGCTATVLSVDQIDANSLPYKESTVIFVVSTTGQGDPPDSMKMFWRFLLQRNLTHHFLQGLRYAVFGLGDSGYQKYNFVAKKLDKRLSDLGGVPIIEKGLGDDQHASGYEGALDPWLSSLWNILCQLNPSFFPKMPYVVNPDEKLVDLPKVRVLYHDADKVDSQLATTSEIECLEIQSERTRSMSLEMFSHRKNKPGCFLRMGQVFCDLSVFFGTFEEV